MNKVIYSHRAGENIKGSDFSPLRRLPWILSKATDKMEKIAHNFALLSSIPWQFRLGSQWMSDLWRDKPFQTKRSIPKCTKLLRSPRNGQEWCWRIIRLKSPLYLIDELYSLTRTRHPTSNPFISKIRFQHYLALIQSDCISQIVILYCYHTRLELRMTSGLQQIVRTYSSNVLVTRVNKHSN